MKKCFTKKRMAALTMCVLSSIAGIGYAAEADLNAYEGEEYVVTATKTKLEAKEVPMATEVLTREKIQELGAYSVQDALRLSLGLDVHTSGMTGNQVQIRGMETRHALILIDGKRVSSENTSNTINVYELNRVNMADVERIEVIRGNGSALYGSDAMGGVINIITKNPNKEGGTAGVYTGTLRSGTNFSYSTGKVGKLSAKLSGGLEKVRKAENSYYSNSAGGTSYNTNMYGPRRFLNASLEYDLGHNRSITFDGNFMREQFRTDGATPSSISKYWYDNNRSDYALTFAGRDHRNDYSLRAYYSNYRKFNYTVVNGATNDFDHSVYETTVIEGKDTWTIDKNNKLTFGAEFKDTSMKGTRFGGGGDNKYTETMYGITKNGSEKSTESYAAYVQDEMRIGDKLLLVPAVRYDHYESFGGKASPKIGATYSFSDNSRFKLNYGKGFRAPTVYELYSTMEKYMGGMVVNVLGNENLKAEESKNFDVSFEGEQGKFNAKLTYFHNKIDNLIDSKMIGMGYVPGVGIMISTTYVNVDKAAIKGTEAQIGYQFDKHWSVKATHSYLDARDAVSHERLENRARQTGTVQLTYTDAKEKPLVATLWNQYNVDYIYDSNVYTFATTNLIVNKKLGKNFDIYAGVDNIFDKKLYQDDDHTYVIDGRTWRVGAEWTF